MTEEDLVTWGENMNDKIEELVKRIRSLAVQQSFELVRKAVM